MWIALHWKHWLRISFLNTQPSSLSTWATPVCCMLPECLVMHGWTPWLSEPKFHSQRNLQSSPLSGRHLCTQQPVSLSLFLLTPWLSFSVIMMWGESYDPNHCTSRAFLESKTLSITTIYPCSHHEKDKRRIIFWMVLLRFEDRILQAAIWPPTWGDPD